MNFIRKYVDILMNKLGYDLDLRDFSIRRKIDNSVISMLLAAALVGMVFNQIWLSGGLIVMAIAVLLSIFF